MSNEEQQEELEAIRAIFDEEYTEISSHPPCFMIKVPDGEVTLSAPISLKIQLPSDYPATAPSIEVPMRSKVLSSNQQKDLIKHLYLTADSMLDTPMIYSLVEAARDWLDTNFELPQESTEDTERTEEEVTTPLQGGVSLVEPKVTGGRWDFVIGLVGKPSAGKSTFFNAATTSDLAKTGAHPFTTIEPNVGKAFFGVPCPCKRLGVTCNAAYMHNSAGERNVPVLLKDVAGLVPGAADGKGRGNRFLGELCDADVLVHIVDASGRTDEKGDETSDYDPGKDVVWLRDEIYRWIYDNVKSKWESILRRPNKLVDMFTGYHAKLSTIHAAIESAGIGEKELANIGSWTDELSRIVKQFLRIRFPIFLVLNKADAPSSRENIQRICSEFPDMPSLPVSARYECFLQQMWREKKIVYSFGSRKCDITGQLSPHEQQTLADINKFWQSYQSTNVQQALGQVISLRAPVFAYPVSDLDTVASIEKYRDEAAGSRLRDCVMLKPGTSTELFYDILRHYPVKLCAGDFVRAECLDATTNKKRIMRKDEVITPQNSIIRIFTNKKIPFVKSREPIGTPSS